MIKNNTSFTSGMEAGKFIPVLVCTLCGNLPDFEIGENDKYKAVCPCLTVGREKGYATKIEAVEAWNKVQEDLRNWRRSIQED